MTSKFLILLVSTFFISIIAKEIIDYSYKECRNELRSKSGNLNADKMLTIDKEYLPNLTYFSSKFMKTCSIKSRIVFESTTTRNAVLELKCKYLLNYFEFIAFERDFDSFNPQTIEERFNDNLTRDGFKAVGDSVCNKYVRAQVEVHSKSLHTKQLVNEDNRAQNKEKISSYRRSKKDELTFY